MYFPISHDCLVSQVQQYELIPVASNPDSGSISNLVMKWFWSSVANNSNDMDHIQRKNTHGHLSFRYFFISISFPPQKSTILDHDGVPENR